MNKLNLPKVEQFHAKNQFLIKSKGMLIFQSYNSIIAVIKTNGSVILDPHYWDFSKTTGKYRNKFLNSSKEITRKKIKSGEYKLANLN